MIELEKKLLVSKEEYDSLMERFGYDNQKCKKTIIKQINYYFDTDDLLMNRQNITCRIRLKDGKYKGTMKHHSQNSDHSTETNIEVYNGITSNSFTYMGLKLQGELTTERCVIFQDDICEVVLDKNEYLDYTDFEVEIEYALSFEHHAERVLNTIIDYLTNSVSIDTTQELHDRTRKVQSKSTRFFERFALRGRR